MDAKEFAIKYAGAFICNYPIGIGGKFIDGKKKWYGRIVGYHKDENKVIYEAFHKPTKIRSYCDVIYTIKHNDCQYEQYKTNIKQIKLLYQPNKCKHCNGIATKYKNIYFCSNKKCKTRKK